MKKLLAIAIAAAVSVPALADTKLYGQLHASYDILDADGTGVKSINSVASNSSRIGVKGSSELNAGLKVIYQAEWGMDTGGKNSPKDSVFSNRNQVVGIAGGFGAILLGRHDTPFKTVGRKADLFWSTQLGQNRSVTNPGTWDLRVNNVIAYQTPKMGGFQSLAAYVTDLGGSDDNTAFSINGFYNAGPIMVGAGYETHDLEGSADIDAVRLMATYKVGPAKLVGFYQTEDNAGVDADVFGLGAAYKVGAGTVKGQYYNREVDGGIDSDLFAIGYDHKLGKKTDVYAQFATISDGAKLGGAGHGESIQSTDGGDADGLSIGIRHKF
jgi:predicted porin